VCPVELRNEFEGGLFRRKAVDKEYKLAIPDTYTLIHDACTKCGECLKVCPTDAINLDAIQEASKTSLEQLFWQQDLIP